MDQRVQDYYDIPSNLLPLPNFANRPATDISMLDGSLLLSPSLASLFDENDEDVDSAEEDRHISCKSLEFTLSRPDPLERPTITVTAPGDERSIRKRSLSDNVTDRPQMPLSTPVSPSGALCPPTYAPPQPRRAVSARLRPSSILKKGKSPLREFVPRRTSSLRIWPLTEVPDLVARDGKAEPKSLGQSHQPNHSSTKAPEKMLKDTLELSDTGSGSFASETLSTLSESLNESTSKSEEAGTNVETTSTNQKRPRPQSSSQRPTTCGSLSSGSSSADEDTPDFDTLARDEEILSAGQRHIYLPGPISLETSRRDSSMSPCFKAMGGRFSDMVGHDSIVMFFEEFGVVEEVTEETLDRFWLNESRRSQTPSKHSPILLSEEDEKVPDRDRKSARSPLGWRVHSSAASSTSLSSTRSQSPHETAKRQRMTFKSFFSGGRPGPALLKTHATWS
ncbi:hypothetical protein IQ07DRAFT_185125 [Pyrenochaeta sp. DS3sAY3a]|nr:hypothetical protein IQ07DRAFT_185125 [Pyrenochaeta sp. DS3sAY3a]